MFLPSDSSSFLTEYWEQLKFCSKLEDRKFDKFDVLYVAWIVFNPTHLLGPRHEHELELSIPPIGKEQFEDPICDLLVTKSLGRNNAVHNAIEYYEYEFERLKGLSNSILKSNLTKEEKKAALIHIQSQLANAPKLIKRAYRFYEWLPHEIVAKQLALQFHMHFYAEEGEPLPYFNYGE